jgi:hypothetical protein
MSDANTQKTKCLVLKEGDDIKSYGFSKNGFDMVLSLSEHGFSKCENFFYIRDFIFHFYSLDMFGGDFVGVYRYEKCEILNYDDKLNKITIRVYNKKFYNVSETKLLRKDKIGNILNDFDNN